MLVVQLVMLVVQLVMLDLAVFQVWVVALDLAAQGGLRNVQLPRCRRDVLLFGYHQERLQLPDFHFGHFSTFAGYSNYNQSVASLCKIRMRQATEAG